MSSQDDILEAVEQALNDDPKLREAPAEEVARRLVMGGYSREEPPISSVADALATVEAEEQALDPGIHPTDV